MNEMIARRRHNADVYLLFFFSGMAVTINVDDEQGNPVDCKFRFGRNVRPSCPEVKRSPRLGGGVVFALVFGTTAFAISTVLAAFMAGLALGSFYFGRFIDKRGNPLRIYAYLEISIGIYALILPFLISLLNNIYTAAYRQLLTSFLAINIIKFIL